MSDHQPFVEQLTPAERSGALKDIFEITKGDDGFTIKKYADLKPGENRIVNLGNFSYEITLYQWPESEPDVGTFEFSQNRKQDYETLKSYLGPQVAETLFVFGEDENGQKANFEVQRKIHGRAIADVSEDEFLENAQATNQLKQFVENSLKMFREIGWLSDVHEDLLANDNLILDEEGNLHLIDTDAVFKIPKDLLHKYKGKLYTNDGLNPNLYTELKQNQICSRYVSDFAKTVKSFVDSNKKLK